MSLSFKATAAARFPPELSPIDWARFGDIFLFKLKMAIIEVKDFI